VRDRNVELILMGHPLHMSGREGRQAEYTKEFAAKLAERTGLRIEFWDERLTTVAAQRVLKDSGISIEKRAQAVDRLSAVILLESYLDPASTPRKRTSRLNDSALISFHYCCFHPVSRCWSVLDWGPI